MEQLCACLDASTTQGLFFNRLGPSLLQAKGLVLRERVSANKERRCLELGQGASNGGSSPARLALDGRWLSSRGWVGVRRGSGWWRPSVGLGRTLVARGWHVLARTWRSFRHVSTSWQRLGRSPPLYVPWC